ncbi:DEAD/DEAH box helicase family protein [Nocardioides psychrotolerans]|uniref:DEAD/DEAH box helicase n=1 Tax=Nocardioides psychrotolerans TaxID=1005945 RepID=UPI003137EC7E
MEKRLDWRVPSLTLRAQLWPHQLAAVTTIDGYLNKARGAQVGAALVTMPTGTGKSAVIAAAIENLSARRPVRARKKHVLVVAPWRGIVDQLTRDLRHRVWERLEAQRPETFPEVHDLPVTKEIGTLKQVRQPTVFVATTAKILQIYGRSGGGADDMRDLFAQFDAVFVDECHYEPAPRWSEALRSIARPTVLLTATPYRNDHKYFVVDPESQYGYSYADAVDDGFLRTPEFVPFTGADTAVFATELVGLIHEKTESHPDTRVIVRCRKATDIRELVELLRSKPYGKSAIGIHESFTTDEPAGLYRYVPNPDKTNDQIWVHQFKLVEGLDDPRFRILAFYDGLSNDRGTVQQIGRVLRNPRRSDTDDAAWVAHRPNFDVKEVWDNYKIFDVSAGEGLATRQELVTQLIAAAPTSIYYDGRFRVPLSLETDNAWRHLKFPLAARIYRPGAQMDLGQLANEIEAEWREEDREIQTRQYPSENAVILPFVSVANSPYLRTAAFLEARFGFTLLRHVGHHLFVFDTEGRTPESLGTIPLEVPSRLSRLLAKDSRLTTVSLDNTDLGRRAVRARTIRAAAIEDVAPGLADYAYVCSVAEGYPPASRDEDRFRRYLGISRSRLRDSRDSPNTYASFVEWSDSIAKALDGRMAPAATFRRYADTSKVPDDKAPLHVLLDVVANDFDRPGDGETRQELDLHDYASEIHNGSGTLRVERETLPFDLSWNSERGRYDFVCPALTKLNYREKSAPRRELVALINAEQRFRVVPASDEFFYANGHFAQPVRPDTAEDRFWLLDALTPVAALDTARSEKGKRRLGDDWEPGSVFNLIDELRKPQATEGPSAAMAEHFGKIDMLLCGDLNSEIADFIAVQPNRIAFIHAKAADGSQLAPSALHEVVSQATKNLLWLQPLNNEVPRAAKSDWNRNWKLTDDKTKVTQLVDRKRLGNFADGEAFWSHARSVIRDPNADREVWLVLGGTLSLSSVRKAVQRPTPELIQLYALLQSAWSATNQVGARMRVFCSR